MPVTAKLSKAFYERLGEQVTNELVEWFNAVDTTYKSDLRDLVEMQAQRFDAKLGQRIAELRAEMRSGLADLRADLLKWMFVYWAGTALTVIGLLKL